MAKSSSEPGILDKFLSGLDEPRHVQLSQIISFAKSLVPEAEEVISYGMPALSISGGVFLGFAATASFASLYPFSGGVLPQLTDELKGYTYTKGALHLSAAHPLSEDLLAKIIKLRIDEINHQSPDLTN